MLQHLVVAKFKEGVPAQEQAGIVAGLRALPAQIAEIRRYDVGLDVLHSARSYDLGIVSAFDDVAALERYQAHPAHVAVAQRLRAASQSIVVVDYDLTPPASARAAAVPTPTVSSPTIPSPTSPVQAAPAQTANKYKKIVQGVAERLMEDERLRANLSDDEANLVINWAVGWLESQVAQASDEASARQVAQAEAARLRPAMLKINDTLPSGAGAFSAGKSDPDRQAAIKRQIAQLTEAWSKR